MKGGSRRILTSVAYSHGSTTRRSYLESVEVLSFGRCQLARSGFVSCAALIIPCIDPKSKATSGKASFCNDAVGDAQTFEHWVASFCDRSNRKALESRSQRTRSM